MNQAPVKLGPLALLLTVISICLTILSILTYTTAGADDRLAKRYAETVSERYELEIQGQEALAAFPEGFEKDPSANGPQDDIDEVIIDEVIIEEVVVEDGAEEAVIRSEAEDLSDDNTLWRIIRQGDLSLTIGVVPKEDGSPQVTAWTYERAWSQDTHINNLWNGAGNE